MLSEKPGVQALAVTAPDLPPVPGKAETVSRDYEYVRHGTVSILAGIDLHSGQMNQAPVVFRGKKFDMKAA